MAGSTVGVEPVAVNPASVLANSVVVTNSVTQTNVLTVPAGRTWVGQVVVISTNLITVAAAQNTRAIIAGTGALPAVGTIIALATSARDTASTVVAAKNVTITAPSGNAVTVDLLNSTNATYSGTVSCYGNLVG
jgi:hypothetical protein